MLAQISCNGTRRACGGDVFCNSSVVPAPAFRLVYVVEVRELCSNLLESDFEIGDRYSCFLEVSFERHNEVWQPRGHNFQGKIGIEVIGAQPN